jgi:glyoxylate/hydroxypyruvate reductase A
VIRLEDAGMAAQMVDYCCHELLHLAGRHHDYAALQAQRRWHEVDALPRESLPVGVLGLGVLGGHVARALAAAGWPVSGYSRTARTIEGVRTFDGPGGWHAFLAATRVLILMAPLTPATENLVDADALARLQPGGWLINVARGALVVDADLLAALERGPLSGATLDVFRREPLPAEHPFWTHPRIRITPHVSAPTRIAESAAQVADKVLAMQRGQRPSGWVDRARGY